MTGRVAPVAITPGAEAGILALNNEHATELSWLDSGRLAALVSRAFHARCIGDAEAFLLALDERAEYDSPNFRWFRERYQSFGYVDRRAVASAARGRGHARRLYADLIGRTAASGRRIIGCEVNFEPPNPASDALHAALGFSEVGRAVIGGGSKTVRYLVCPVCRPGAGAGRASAAP